MKFGIWSGTMGIEPAIRLVSFFSKEVLRWKGMNY